LKGISKLLLVTNVISMLTACNNQLQQKPQLEEKSITVLEPEKGAYIVKLINTNGKEVGSVTLGETNEGVSIKLKGENLSPGKHAFHIHSVGKCDKPNFDSADDHVNPSKNQHGFDHPKGPHAGDLPNIEVGADGKIDIELNAPLVTLEKGEKHSILDDDGSAFIIHEGADDYSTDPDGHSGPRLICGSLSIENAI
jgi:superoxide dismutase, Cu-Zn family